MTTDLIIGGYGCALALLGAIGSALAARRLDDHVAPASDPMLLAFVGAGFVLIGIGAAGIDLHELRKFGRSLRKMIASFAGALAALSLVAGLTGRGGGYLHGTVWLWFLLGCGGLAALHGVVSRCLRASPAIRELCARRVAIVGGHDRTCARFLDLLLAQQDPDMRLVGVFHAGADRRCLPGAKAGRTLEDLVDLVRCRRVDEVFIALPWHAERRISALVDRLGHLPVDLKLCPDRVGYARTMMLGERLYGVPVATLNRQPIRDWARVGKRVMDLVLGAAALAALALPMVLIATVIKLDSPGPVLFRQHRQGFDHDLFEMLKFRTMRHEPEAPFAQAHPHDARVTRVGHWLRRTSLDELPQLINVLRGEMSLVGPRPHPVALNAAFMRRIQRFATRHRVKPGITGLAQVNGWRGETDTEDKMAGRVVNDLYYIENWSLLLDLKIMALTVLTGFARRNAH
jgi:Undecaprenyl-phosphate glucose phosphotransferase